MQIKDILICVGCVIAIALFVVFGCKVDDTKVYPEGRQTLDVTGWYTLDSSMHGCKVYYMHGSDSAMKFKIGENAVTPVDLYVLNCNGAISIATLKAIDKKK